MKHTGPYASLADAVHAQRATARREATRSHHAHAIALAEMARALQGLIRTAQEIPGTYRIWARLVDAQTEADALAAEWEARHSGAPLKLTRLLPPHRGTD